jgi:large subunit ribosomal protein L19e
MKLTTQRRLGSELLKCGIHRIWIDPDRISEVEEAITKKDIRNLIKNRAIKKLPAKGISKARKKIKLLKKRKGKRKGIGSRKSSSYARLSKKQQWAQRIRAQRKVLRNLRNSGKITKQIYRKYYLLAKGGMFKSKAHLESQLKSYIKE